MWGVRVVRALPALILVGCQTPLDASGARLADLVLAAAASSGPFGDPTLAVNGVRGGGLLAGSVDVFSLGFGHESALTLGFSEPVLDGEGPDLAVFENPFDVSSGGRFFDPVVVEVSADCQAFTAFPFVYDGGPWTGEPARWHGFAGLTPVELHEEDYPVDPLSPDAGGDRFDLADLQDGPAEVSCVRLTSAAAFADADGVPLPADPASNGPDIDGVYGRAPTFD